MHKKSLHPFTLLALLTAMTALPGAAQQSDTAKTPAEQLVDVILSKGYKRIAILPKVVSHTSAATSPVTGKNTIGALSMAWPEELYDALIQASLKSDGKFEVVTDQQVLLALKGQKGEDVGSAEMWKVIREKTGADFLASIDVTDPGPTEGKVAATTVKRTVNGVDLMKNSAVGRVKQDYAKSLSDGAYAGESFVVREWEGKRLKATGLARGKLFDFGAAAEKDQYQNLVSQEHPLLRKNYPYGISVEVGGKPRTPQIVDGQFVVPLDMGEEYVVSAWNHGDRDVFMALYVDGVNTIGGQLERPDLTPTHRTWFMKPDKKESTIKGWQKVDPTTKKAFYEKFVIKSADESVARESNRPGGDGFSDNLGMITAVFYTYGTDDIPPVRGAPAPVADGIGTGRGEKQIGGIAGFDPNAKQKGLLLSAVTLYYRSPHWFEENQTVKPEPQVAEATTAKPVVPAPASKTSTPDEPKPEKKPAKPKKDSENDLPD